MRDRSYMNMTSGDVARLLLSFALPIFISNLFQQFYNVVDIAVIGHVLGDQALAAVGATSALYSLIIGFINGMSNGYCVVLARFFGARQEQRFRQAIWLALVLSAITVLVVTIMSLLSRDSLLHLLQTPETIFMQAKEYISIILLFCVVTFAYNFLSSLLRAIGNSVVPLYALIIASMVNVVLDIALVGGMHMGVAGAAIATVIAQALSVCYLLYYILRHCDVLHIKQADCRWERHTFGELVTTGLSMAMMLVLVSIGTVALQGGINGFGDLTITGHTAARKIHDMCMLPYGAISTATATFVSQNYGAKNGRRIKEGMKYSLFAGFGWSVIVLAFVLLLGRILVTLLTGTQSETVLSVSLQYLRWNVPFYFLVNILLIMRSSLQAVGSKVMPLIASLLELAGKFICVLWLVPNIGYLGICLVEPVTWLASLVVVVAGFGFKMKELRRFSYEK